MFWTAVPVPKHCAMLMYKFMHKALALYGGEWLALCSNELHSFSNGLEAGWASQTF